MDMALVAFFSACALVAFLAVKENDRKDRAAIESILKREVAIMATEYHEGPHALKNFEDGMKKLFQASKPESPFKSPPAKPKVETSKD